MITYNDVMAASNPFVYGEVVTAAAFADREDERARLARDLRRPEGVPHLSAPVRQVVARPRRDEDAGREGILTVEVTVAASSSYVGFLEAYARALVAADTPAAASADGRRSSSGRPSRGALRSRPAPGSRGASLTFPTVRSARDAARLATEVFALPRGSPSARRQRIAVALDEFQTIAAFDGGNVEHALRAAVQEQHPSATCSPDRSRR